MSSFPFPENGNKIFPLMHGPIFVSVSVNHKSHGMKTDVTTGIHSHFLYCRTLIVRWYSSKHW